MKKALIFTLALAGCATILTGCGSKTTKATTKKATTAKTYSYDFVIYEKDSDNTDLSDNPIVATYHITTTATNVADSLIKGSNNKYYFEENGTDYLTLADSAYGLSYDKGYFKDFSECADNTEIDVSWSISTVNGEAASTGISSTTLEGLTTYGFVIQGWKTN